MISGPDPDALSEPPVPRPTLRDRADAWAEQLDVSLTRLLAGVAALLVLGVVGWRLLSPGPPPPEMTLPMVQSTEPEADAGESASPVAETSRTSGDSVGRRPGVHETGAAAEGDRLVVHVAGAVRAPGVQRVQPGSRVVEAVDAAGGALDDADLARVNLAAHIEDGQQIYIPRVGEEPPVPAGASGGLVEGGGPEPGSGRAVNVNTASAQELEALHGVGPATAEAIVAYREAHGPFRSVEQLTEVRGIGKAKLETLRDDVTI